MPRKSRFAEPEPSVRHPQGTHGHLRVLAALAVAVAMTAVPIATVSACTCGGEIGDEAIIREVDVAFVGTVVRSSEPWFGGGVPRYTFAIERARDEMTSPFEIKAGSGSCGVDMNDGERWFVMAVAPRGQRGIPSTHFCISALIAEIDPNDLALLDEKLAATPVASESAGSLLGWSSTLTIVGLGVLVVGLLSIVAFRSRRVR